MEDLAQSVPTFLVFREPGAGIPRDLHETMDSLCRLVGETPPRTYHLFGILHPAVLLHWRVQAHLVSRLSSALRRAYWDSSQLRRSMGAPYPIMGCVGYLTHQVPPQLSGDYLLNVLAAQPPAMLRMSPPGSPLDQVDHPPEGDGASLPRNANRAEEVPIQDLSNSSLVPWEPCIPELKRILPPTRNTHVPLPEP